METNKENRVKMKNLAEKKIGKESIPVLWSVCSPSLVEFTAFLYRAGLLTRSHSVSSLPAISSGHKGRSSIQRRDRAGFEPASLLMDANHNVRIQPDKLIITMYYKK